jgi:hypothetical protein
LGGFKAIVPAGSHQSSIGFWDVLKPTCWYYGLKTSQNPIEDWWLPAGTMALKHHKII